MTPLYFWLLLALVLLASVWWWLVAEKHVGFCRLCRQLRSLRESHFMPAALYPANKRKKGKIAAATRDQVFASPNELKDYLLCADCEGRFSRRGESEVLKWIAPKARAGTFPLLAALEKTPVIWRSEEFSVHSGVAAGIDTEHFAYFALSLIWRASIHEWLLPDGSRTKRIVLRAYGDQIRQYLLEKSPFPPSAVVTAAVCTDQYSREHWWTPPSSEEKGCLTFPILVMGLVLRVWLGESIPTQIQRSCCRTGDRPFILTHCDDQTERVLSGLAPLPGKRRDEN